MPPDEIRSLDSILNGENTSEGSAAAEASASADEKADASGRPPADIVDDTGARETGSADDDAAKAKAEADAKAAADALAAAKAKDDADPSALTVLRKELQKTQRELAELKRGKKEPEKAPDPVEDPEGYEAHVDRKIATSTFDAVARISERAAIKTYGKETYDAMVDVFEAAVEKDPSLAKQLRESDDPAEFAFQTGKSIHERGGPNVSVAEATAKAVKAAEEKMEKEIGDRVKKAVDEIIAKRLPKSLADEQSGSGGGKVENPAERWAGPRPINEILGEKSRRR